MTGPPVHRARMTATASSSRATRSGGRREIDPVGRVLLRMPADADAEHEPSAARDLQGRGHPRHDRRVPVHDVEHERPDLDPARGTGGHRQRGPALDDRHRQVAAAHEVVPAPRRRRSPPRRGDARSRATRPARRGSFGARPRSAGVPTRRQPLGHDPSQPRLEEPDVLGADRVTVAACRPERRPRAQGIEIGREPPDQVEDDLLDPLGVRGEDLEDDRSRSTASVPSWTPAS